jgi:hypothetical protein
LEKVQGDLNDDVMFCFNVTNTSKCKLSHVVIKNIVLKFKDTTIGKLDIGQSVMIHVDGTIQESVVNNTTTPSFFDWTNISDLDYVMDEDPSQVEKIEYSPNVKIDNTVYLGNDNGTKCNTNVAKEKVGAVVGADVVYCFVVTNCGETYLGGVEISNVVFTFKYTIGKLSPGQNVTVPYQTKMNGDIINFADVVGHPIKDTGEDLIGIDDVVDSDASKIAGRQGAPSIDIDNKVYIGNNGGIQCGTDKPVDRVNGQKGTIVWYCFTITDKGNTHLGSIKIQSIELAFTDTTSVTHLAPGEKVHPSS